MRQTVRISGKNLGILSLANCCDRCFWIQLKMGFKLPFSIFPGIFSSLDAYTKRVVHGHFDEHGCPPPWLAQITDIVEYIEPPHWSRFNITDQKHGILLTGMPDGVFMRRDHSYVIADYKTARFTGLQDELLPMYQTQLNVYAMIGEQCGFRPVSGLVLIYMEPNVNPSEGVVRQVRNNGFDLGFVPHILDVPRRPDTLEPLLARVQQLSRRRRPPAGRQKCRNCELMSGLAKVWEVQASPAKSRGRGPLNSYPQSRGAKMGKL